jgi:TolB-like protein/Tfp pilus assembly protein PilF
VRGLPVVEYRHMGLLSELKRRNVYRMAALYMIAAWLVMQVTEVVMTLAALPKGAGEIVLILLAIGFPIALIFSWFYELTPEGLSLEKDVHPTDSITHLTGRRMDFVVIALLCAALVVFAYDKWWMSGPPLTSIAVLPLESLSDDPEQDYFAEEMTGVLITELTKIDGLQILSKRTAARLPGSDKSLPEIARELGVHAIIDGSTQWAGDKVHLNLQLVDSRTDRHLWADRYVRDVADIFALQSELARAIAKAIRLDLTPATEARLAHDRKVVPDAVRFWLIGNQHLKGLHEDSFDKALRAFEEAIRHDPEFANAYAGVAQSYAYLGSWHGRVQVDTVLPIAKAAAQKAIQLDRNLAEAHFALAHLHVLDWDWEAANREYTKGSELNPSDATGLLEYANFLCSMGQFEESVKAAMRALEIDPLSPATHNELGSSLWFAGHNDAALAKYHDALQLDPEFFQTLWILADFHLEAGEHDKALPFLNQLKQDFENLAPGMIGLLGRNYARVGHRNDALELLSYLLKRMETEYIPGSALAYIYIGLEEYDEALAWLEVAYEQRDNIMVWLREGPEFYGLHDDSRFQDLVARMDFPVRNRNED